MQSLEVSLLRPRAGPGLQERIYRAGKQSRLFKLSQPRDEESRSLLSSSQTPVLSPLFPVHSSGEGSMGPVHWLGRGGPML